MSRRAGILRGAAILTAGQVTGQALGFARNIVIARLLSPHDVGVAATLAITLSLVELVADVSIDKLLIQARDGDDPKLQASCQAALALRGLLQGLALFALAGSAAALFALPGLVWAFQLIAIGPVIKGLGHADVGRVQRQLRFGPAAVAELIPQAAALAAVVPLALYFGDFRAVLASTLLSAGLYTLCTHALAERAYRWSWDAAALRRIAAFGWPLMVNGALLFAIAQGDRIAIGAGYSKEELALWANAMLLASAPMMVLGKVAVSIALPVLARSKDDRAAFERHYQLCMQGLAWVGAVVAVPLVLGGGAIMALVFGEAYGAAGAFVGLLAIGQAARACRIGPTVAALAHGETKNPAIGNFVRLGGVAIAVYLAVRGAPLAWIAGAGLVGEVASFGAGALRLKAKGLLAIRQSVKPMIPAAVCLCIGAVFVRRPIVASEWAMIWAIGGAVFVGGVLLVFFERLRREPALLCAALRGRRA